MRKPISHIIKLLQENLSYIKNKYKVDSIELFGSYIRAEETDQSDVDILVTFTEAPSLIKFIELENFLSDKLGLKVDLVMKNALKKNIRQHILKEARAI